MKMSNDSHFTNLLRYLEKEQSKHQSLSSFEPTKKINKTSDGDSKRSSNHRKKSPVPARDKIKKVSESIHCDNPFYDKTKSSSKGFDVNEFESLMRSRLIKSEQKSQNYVRPYISVSESLCCIRKGYYKRLKYKVDINKVYSFAYLDLINEIGNRVHDFIQSVYSFDETEKTIISEEYKVKGRIDAVKENCLVEFKTIDPDKFDGKYLEAHYNQGLVYAYILNTDYGFKIDTITIVYIIRTLKKIIPFDLPINSEKAISLLKNAFYLKSCIESNQVPEPTNSDSEQCKYCPYIKYCKEDNSDMDKPHEYNQQKSVFLL